ncbi:hypothetical protein glysoja_015743 [Glycine soja]|nr:hypothetical protein glysoja_015743 [Glycine soja]
MEEAHGSVYLTVVWLLASVTTVLEDSYGNEAMMKSKELIKGKMGLSVMIVMKLNFLFFLVQFLFSMVVVNGWKGFGLGSMDRTHCEIVDKSALSYHLEVYECYEPLKTKDVQLDYHV